MTYAGQILKVLFTPFKLITVPLQWLFRHRCVFEPGSNVCTSVWCAVGKRKEDGWRQWRAGEWVKTPKRTLPSLVQPPPPFPNGRHISVKITG